MYIIIHIFNMLGDVRGPQFFFFRPSYSRALFGLRVDAFGALATLASNECGWPSRSLFQKASGQVAGDNKNATHLGGSINGGTPIAGWFIGKIPSFEMDDDWGYPHDYGNPHVFQF